MSEEGESAERALLRRVLQQGGASLLSVASDGSGVLRLRGSVVVSPNEMRLISALLR